MTFRQVAFQPAAGISVSDANIEQDAHAALMPGDQRQYLYICEPDKVDGLFEGDALFEQARKGSSTSESTGQLALGTFDLSWRSTGGEEGKLQTALMSRRVPPVGPNVAHSASSGLEVALVVESLSTPQPLLVEQPFTVHLAARVRPLRPAKGTYMVQPIYHHRSASQEVELATAPARSDPARHAPLAAAGPKALPPPVPIAAGQAQSQDAPTPSPSLVYLGPPLIELASPEAEQGHDEEEQQVFHFTLPYLSTEAGLVNIGGLRLLFKNETTSEVVRLAHFATVAQALVAADVSP